MEEMTPRERIMTALRNGQPDRVPATPDISVMVPSRLSGKPFWELEYNGNPPLWKAYIDAARFFGIDGWLVWGRLDYRSKSEVVTEKAVVEKSADRWVVRSVVHTPDGDLTQTTVYPKDNPGTTAEKLIKHLESDYKKLRHLFPDTVSCDDTVYREQRKAMGDQGMICVFVAPPGFQNWVGLFDGNLEALTYAYQDYREIFEEFTELYERAALQRLEMALDVGVDSILTGGSGSITLQSPELFRKLSLPTLKKITAMCRQAGVLCGIHSCGKEYAVVEACANETALDYINPLEPLPMGDCDLAVCKRNFGHRLALMGNLHTTEVMLLGKVEDVRRESLKAILAAGSGGGFVLSTGDQCGRDTPFENIREIAAVAKEYGRYPLDLDRIKAEIQRLEHLRG